MRVDPARLEDLILARLALRSAAPTPKQVSKALYAIVARQLTKTEWDALFERALDGLRVAGLVGAAKAAGQGSAPPSKGRASKTTKGRTAKTSKRGAAGSRASKPAARQGLTLTRAGQKRLQAVFGAKTRVAARDWPELERKYVPGLLFPDAPARTKPAELSAIVLGQRLGVAAGDARTKEQVLDAWLRSSLGLRAGERLTLDNLRAALLARELGLPQRRSLKLQDVLGLAAVQLSGAASGADDDVSAALLLRWLSDARAEPKREPRPEPPPPVERIAAKALRAAEGPQAREFGPNKVFIGSVWRALAADPEIGRLDEAAFKRQLVEAHRRGLLVLSRADLVAAMDPSDLAASEIKHQNATYHFISRGASA